MGIFCPLFFKCNFFSLDTGNEGNYWRLLSETSSGCSLKGSSLGAALRQAVCIAAARNQLPPNGLRDRAPLWSGCLGMACRSCPEPPRVGRGCRGSKKSPTAPLRRESPSRRFCVESTWRSFSWAGLPAAQWGTNSYIYFAFEKICAELYLSHFKYRYSWVTFLDSLSTEHVLTKNSQDRHADCWLQTFLVRLCNL